MDKKISSETVRKHDHMMRLSDQYGETVRERMVAIPDSVHNRIKEVAMRLQMPVYEAYTDAGRMWLKAKGVSAELDGIGPVGASEEQLVSDILNLYRLKDKYKVFKETINAVRLLVAAAMERH